MRYGLLAAGAALRRLRVRTSASAFGAMPKGKPCPWSNKRLHVEPGPVDAFLVAVHAVLLAGRAARDDAPAVCAGFAEGLHSHENKV